MTHHNAATTLVGSLHLPPMSLFAHTRSRRRTAIAVLGAWVFALIAGIANACAAITPEPSHARSEHPTALAGHDHAAPALSGAEQDDQAGRSHGLKPPCKKFCDEEATTVVKHDKACKVVPTTTPITTVVVSWLPTFAVSLLRACMDAAPPPEAPLTIRFLRLTI